MYKLLDILNPNQINFLSSIGIDISDKEYTGDEVSDIYFGVMDKLSDNLGDEITSPDEYSKRCSDILSTLSNKSGLISMQ